MSLLGRLILPLMIVVITIVLISFIVVPMMASFHEVTSALQKINS